MEHLSKTIDGVKVLDDISFVVGREDKIAFVGSNGLAKTTLFQILAGQMEPDEGSYKWGITTSQSYFPKDNTKDFDSDDAIVDWLTTVLRQQRRNLCSSVPWQNVIPR